MDERLRHQDGSIQSRYSCLTPAMRRLLDGLTEAWEAALGERRSLAHCAPVAAFDRLLSMRRPRATSQWGMGRCRVDVGLSRNPERS